MADDTRKAILSGTLEAARAHQDLGLRERWERDGARIDVFGAIDRSGLWLMLRPLEGLLGAYLVRPAPGVLVSTRRPPSVRRYTAAHELGHHRLGHRPSLDGEDMITRTPLDARIGYDPQEVAADAFAIRFLMPNWLVGGQMRRRGWGPSDMRDPKNVYQLALRAGVSYQATCHALRSHKVIDQRTSTALTQVQPKAIKQALVPGLQPESWRLDVWHLDQADDGAFVEVAAGDIVDVELLEHSGGGYLWDVGGLGDTDLELLSDRRERIGPAGAVGGHVTRRLVARARATGVGSVQFVERRPWDRAAARASYRFSYVIHEPGKQGLLDAQRELILAGGVE